MSATPSPKDTARNPLAGELVGVVSILNGQGEAELRRMSDPDGRAVVQARVRGTAPDQIMARRGDIGEELADAGERFRSDFLRGHLVGHMPAMDLGKVGGKGPMDMGDHAYAARARALKAMGALGGMGTLSARIVWFAVGEGQTLEAVSLRIRNGGGSMNPQKAAGILTGALERLAVFYGDLKLGDLRAVAHRQGYRDGAAAAADVVAMAIPGQHPASQRLLRQLAEQIRTKLARKPASTEGETDR
jgi:hypothetical protein